MCHTVTRCPRAAQLAIMMNSMGQPTAKSRSPGNPMTSSCQTSADATMLRPAVGYQQKFINSTVGSQLLRFAAQKHLGDLTLAHMLWDRLMMQGDVPDRQACRCYYLALQQRDPDEARLEKVRAACPNHHHHLLVL